MVNNNRLSVVPLLLAGKHDYFKYTRNTTTILSRSNALQRRRQLIDAHFRNNTTVRRLPDAKRTSKADRSCPTVYYGNVRRFRRQSNTERIIAGCSLVAVWLQKEKKTNRPERKNRIAPQLSRRFLLFIFFSPFPWPKRFITVYTRRGFR